MQLRERRGEIARREVGLEQLAQGWGKLVEALDPGAFAPIRAHQRQARVGPGEREGAHRHDARVAHALGVDEDDVPEGVAFESEVHTSPEGCAACVPSATATATRSSVARSVRFSLSAWRSWAW